MGEEGEWSKVERRRQKVKNEGCLLRQKLYVAVGSVGRQVDNPLTFFFTNFPENFGAKEMLKIFQHYGKFSGVVIPAKRNRIGRRFGFTHALGVEDPRRFGVKLDNIFIGCDKIFVNLPKYERDTIKGGWSKTRSLSRDVDQVNHEESSEGNKGLKLQHKGGGKAVRQLAEIQSRRVPPCGREADEARKGRRHSSDLDAPLRFDVEN